VKGDTIDLVPGFAHNPIRIELFGDQVERIGNWTGTPAPWSSDSRTTTSTRQGTSSSPMTPAGKPWTIRAELEEWLPPSMLEAHRLKQRTLTTLEMIGKRATGKWIRNYSPALDFREALATREGRVHAG